MSRSNRREFLRGLIAVPVGAAAVKLSVPAVAAPVRSQVHALRTAHGMARVIKLDNVKLSFPRLLEPGPERAPFRPRFGATFTFSNKSDSVPLRKAISDLARERWGEHWTGTCNIPLHDGDTLRANSSVRPLIVDRDRTPLEESDGKLKPGCYVNAAIALYPLTVGHHRRICAQLRGVQFVKS